MVASLDGLLPFRCTCPWRNKYHHHHHHHHHHHDHHHHHHIIIPYRCYCCRIVSYIECTARSVTVRMAAESGVLSILMILLVTQSVAVNACYLNNCPIGGKRSLHTPTDDHLTRWINLQFETHAVSNCYFNSTL